MPYVAAIQMVSTDKISENLETAKQLIESAARKQARLITLPENFALMTQDKNCRLVAQEEMGQGPIQLFLAEQAKRHQVWLLGGTVPLRSEYTDKVYAASMLYNPDGECCVSYNKIHLFDVVLGTESYHESDSYAAGIEPVVVTTEIGNIGLSVCYDLRFPELYRGMHEKDVQIITIPSAFTATTGVAHWEALLKARAVENLCYVIASNQGGVHKQYQETWGHSMIIDPWGSILAKIDKGTGLILANIDLHKQAQLRQSFPVLTHRKLNYTFTHE